MDVEWFRSFVATAEQKSLSKASEIQHISQPAISKHVTNLENALGRTLFWRSHVGVELTPAGQVALETLKKVVFDVEQLIERLQDDAFTTRLRLGTIPSVSSHYIARRIALIRDALGCDIDVIVQNTSHDVCELLNSGQLDVGILEDFRSLRGAYWSDKLFEESYKAIVPKSHKLSGYESLDLQALKEEPLVVFPSHCDVRKGIVAAYSSQGLQPVIKSEIAFGESILAFVAAQVGITIAPELITDHLATWPLVAIPISDFGRRRTMSIVASDEHVGRTLMRVMSGE